MFEAQVLYYLNLYLGRYVTGLDLQALRISVFKGDLELRNLRLKPEALNKLKLPITVKAGLLGSLKLKVRATTPAAPLTPGSGARCECHDMSAACSLSLKDACSEEP